MRKMLCVIFSFFFLTSLCGCGGERQVEERSDLILNQTYVELRVGETAALFATLKGSSAQPELVWRTTRKDVATVESGVVIAVGEGECCVSVQSKENTATCKVVVKSAARTQSKKYRPPHAPKPKP